MNILVLCTGNSARSILGEAIFNKLGAGRLNAFSAGSKPVGQVNPFALKHLEGEGYDTSVFRSKSWDEFTGDNAPEIGIVVTVCGNAAGEVCPIWRGAPVTVHWGFPDPAGVNGPDGKIEQAFRTVYQGLQANIEAFLTLDFETMSAQDLRLAMQKVHSD